MKGTAMKALLASVLMFASPIVFAAPVAISLGGLVNLVIYLLILAAIVWLLLFIIAKVGPPEPFNKILPAIVYVVAALILIAMLLDLAGSPVVTLR
jgi:hypothetical protein